MRSSTSSSTASLSSPSARGKPRARGIDTFSAPYGQMSDFTERRQSGRLYPTSGKDVGGSDKGQECLSLREWDRWRESLSRGDGEGGRSAAGRFVGGRGGPGRDPGAAVSSAIRPPASPWSG